MSDGVGKAAFLVPGVGGVLALYVLRASTREAWDPDFWWHLAAGRLITESGRVPTHDVLSLAAQGRPWVDHSWLSEVLLYLGWQSLPVTWLSLLGGLLAVAIFLVAYRLLSRETSSGLAVLLGGTAVTWPLQQTWTVRPLVLTVLFLGLTWWLLRVHRDRPTPRLWLLLPLSTLWANLHAGVVFGIALVLYVALAETILARVRSQERPAWTPRQRWSLFLAAAGMTAGAMANPRGATLLAYPFQYLGETIHVTYITEWQSPDFHRFPEIGWFLVVLVAVLGLSRRPKDPVDLVAALVAVLASLTSVRHVALMAVVVSPLLGTHLDDVVSRWRSVPLLDRWHREAKGCGVALALGAILLAGAHLSWRTTLPGGLPVFPSAGMDMRRLPQQEVDYIERTGLSGPMFHLYTWGGYLAFRTQGKPPVTVVDGRAEVYDPGHLRHYFRVLNGQADFRPFFERWGIKVALLKKDDTPLETVLKEAPDWELRYTGRLASVWVHKGVQAGN